MEAELLFEVFSQSTNERGSIIVIGAFLQAVPMTAAFGTSRQMTDVSSRRTCRHPSSARTQGRRGDRRCPLSLHSDIAAGIESRPAHGRYCEGRHAAIGHRTGDGARPSIARPAGPFKPRRSQCAGPVCSPTPHHCPLQRLSLEAQASRCWRPSRIWSLGLTSCERL